MLKYLAKRIGRSILTLFVIVTLVFCLLRLMPVEGYFANYEKMTEAQIQAGLQSMGLLDPLPVQIGRFWWNALHGDLGVSHIYKVNASVTGILAKKLPISIQMGVFAMLLSLVIGIPMGLLMGRFKNRWPDKIGTAIIVLIQAVPAAVYYLYIQMYGTTALGVGLLFDASDWRYWVLPVCSMSLGNVAFYAMWLRRYMVDESNKDYVRLAPCQGREREQHRPAPHLPQCHGAAGAVHSLCLPEHCGRLHLHREPVLHPRHGRPAGHLRPAPRQHHGAGHRAAVRLRGHHRPDPGRPAHGAHRSPHQLWQERRWPIMLFHMKDHKAAVLENRPEQAAEGRPRRLGRPARGRAVHLRRVQRGACRGHLLLQLQLLGQHLPCFLQEPDRRGPAHCTDVSWWAFAFLQPYLPGQADPNLCQVDSTTGIQFRNIAPGEEGFIWGSNAIGQDLWARIWAGARTSLTIAFFVALIEAVVGITVGVLWGYVRQLDFFFTELYNICDNIPSTIILILISYVASPSVQTLILGMSITGWIAMARFIRNQILIIRDRDYNMASRCIGTPIRRIVLQQPAALSGIGHHAAHGPDHPRRHRQRGVHHLYRPGPFRGDALSGQPDQRRPQGDDAGRACGISCSTPPSS